MSAQQKHERILKAAVWIGVLIFLLATAQFAYAGTFSRFWADDYCYSAAVKNTGLDDALVNWYQFNGNRVSTVLVVAAADLFGWQFIQISPLVVLALWIGAWVFFLLQLARLFRWKVTLAGILLLALAQVYFSVYLAPDRVQTIYWRMGTYHYTLPMPLLLINLGILLTGFRRPGKFAAWIGLTSFLFSFFTAGLSETFAAMQTGMLVLATAASLIYSSKQQRGKVIGLLFAALAGSLLMMVVMAMAPANSWRQDVMPPPDNILLVIPYSLRYAGEFIFYTLRGQITPFIVYGALLFVVGILAAPVEMRKISPRLGFAGVGISMMVTYALIVCSFAPSAYANLSYPAGRALMPGNLALLAGLGCAALILGFIARHSVAPVKQGTMVVFAAAMLLLLCFYPIRASALAGKDIVRLSEWAARWDARDQQIRQQVDAGSMDITVNQVNVVESLEDIGPDAAHWINICAAVFYDVRSITAKP